MSAPLKASIKREGALEILTCAPVVAPGEVDDAEIVQHVTRQEPRASFGLLEDRQRAKIYFLRLRQVTTSLEQVSEVPKGHAQRGIIRTERLFLDLERSTDHRVGPHVVSIVGQDSAEWRKHGAPSRG